MMPTTEGTQGLPTTTAEPEGTQQGCVGKGCYTVFAHGDHVLYNIDLQTKELHLIGPFDAPKVNGQEDVITDLAVSPQDIIYGVSYTKLYTVDANDGHVTEVGPITACGKNGVALTFTPDGSLYTADYLGSFCHIDLTQTPPLVTEVGKIGGGLAISGDLVAIADGTVYGTAYKTSESNPKNDTLISIDPKTGKVNDSIGLTGFPKLFGVSYALGQVFGFTHDNTGDVVTIDPKTGKGTLFNSFKDPSMPSKGISFAGAAVNTLVPANVF